jgi:outer membrane protein OmpA-like peptidoglycan-associated protein
VFGKLTMALVTVTSVVTPYTAFSQTPPRASGVALTEVHVPGVAYGSRPGDTRVQFTGTPLMPGASGQAIIEKQKSTVKITAQFTNVQYATSFGHEYLTYVIWALSPDGRAFNIGELVLPDDANAWTSQSAGNRSSLTITTTYQTFAMIVTAEPYYAVKAPSGMVVLESGFEAGTEPLQKVDTTFDLAHAGGYAPTDFKFDSVLLRTNLPLDFFQARNAMRIARAAGAEQYAAAIYANAVGQMQRVEQLAGQKKTDKRALMNASREAVQTAEDARAIAARAVEVQRQEADRRAAVEREAAAKAQAQAEIERRVREEQRAAAAEADRAAAEAARIAAQNERLAAERQKEEADRASREAQAAALEAQRARAAAEESRAAAVRAQAEAEQRQAAALQQQQAAEAEAARNRAAAADLDQRLQQAVKEREELRASLLQQLSVILETRDTARGLVVNLSDVTFATGQATLVPGAREKLARVSGILAAHPTLRLEIEGHTDSVGSDALNQSLSERRAEAVRSYLVQQGVPTGSVTAAGFGKSRPVASNDTADGRQLNRRVELVVSGDAIGTTKAGDAPSSASVR